MSLNMGITEGKKVTILDGVAGGGRGKNELKDKCQRV